jgi:hypothetical protein
MRLLRSLFDGATGSEYALLASGLAVVILLSLDAGSARQSSSPNADTVKIARVRA